MMMPRLISLRLRPLETNPAAKRTRASRLIFSSHVRASPTENFLPPSPPDSMSLRSRSSGVTFCACISVESELAQQLTFFFDQPVDDRLIDGFLVGYDQLLQGIMAEYRDPPGVALGVTVNLSDGLRGEETLARGMPGLPETKGDHRVYFRFIEGMDHVPEADAIPKVFHSSYPREQLWLSHQDELEELVLVRFIVEEATQELQRGRAQTLGFVDQQYDGLVLFHPFLEEILLDHLQGFDNRQRTRFGGNPEELQEGCEELGFCFIDGIEDHMAGNLLLFVQELGEPSAQRRLAHPDDSQDEAEPSFQSDGDLQPVEGCLMGCRLVKKGGIGAGRKWLFL